jgi:pimeloyl-ACP methyl ester carboxylesterase
MAPPDRVVAVGNRFYPLLQKAALEGFANNGEGVLAEAKAVSNACINYSRIRCPVHIWTGGQDNIWPVSTAEYLHRQLPQSQLHILRKGGHLHYLKEWERLVAAFAQQETAKANS